MIFINQLFFLHFSHNACMRWFTFLSFIWILYACTWYTPLENYHQVYELRYITAPWWGSSISDRIGTLVQIDSETYLTTTHSVRDDRYQYVRYDETGIIPLSVIDRDHLSDIAILRSRDTLPSPSWEVSARYFTTVDRVLTPVSIVRVVSGERIISRAELIKNNYISIVDPQIRIVNYSGNILSGVLLRPGESGSPVYDLSGNLIDLVHVGNIE